MPPAAASDLGLHRLPVSLLEIPTFDANSVDPDQTPLAAASDLGLHRLPVSLLWDARHKWVNVTGLR